MADSEEPRVLDLRMIFGLEARITAPAEATDGAYVEMDCTVAPGHGTMIHYHPNQDETYHVLDGTLDVMCEDAWRPVRAGETVEIPRGTVHGFRNRSGAPVRFRNVHRPALGFQAHLETLDRLVRSGKVRGTTDLRSIMHMSISAVTHRPDVPVRPPWWLVRTMAAVGRRLGMTIE